jgi:DNA invertase Pin-like site-specific DNA recombinase
VRGGRVELIALYKLDRLGRSLQHLAQIIGELETHGTALVATSQGIDTSDTNPAGRLQMHVLAAVAEFERSVIIERINAGLAAARARGAKLGRPRTLDRHHSAVARLSRRGFSGRKIATRLKLPAGSVFAVMRALKQSKQSVKSSRSALD